VDLLKRYEDIFTVHNGVSKQRFHDAICTQK